MKNIIGISAFYHDGYDTDPRSKVVALTVIRDGYSFENPNRLSSAFCEKYGFRYISLLNTFRDVVDGPPLYYHIDLHWTPHAQKIAADLLIEKLHAGKGGK
jgi:hypothetical protein